MHFHNLRKTTKNWYRYKERHQNQYWGHCYIIQHSHDADPIAYIAVFGRDPVRPLVGGTGSLQETTISGFWLGNMVLGLVLYHHAFWFGMLLTAFQLCFCIFIWQTVLLCVDFFFFFENERGKALFSKMPVYVWTRPLFELS